MPDLQKQNLAVASSAFMLDTPCERKQMVSTYYLANAMYHGVQSIRLVQLIIRSQFHI